MNKNRFYAFFITALFACSMITQPLVGCADCFAIFRKKTKSGVRVIALIRNKKCRKSESSCRIITFVDDMKAGIQRCLKGDDKAGFFIDNHGTEGIVVLSRDKMICKDYLPFPAARGYDFNALLVPVMTFVHSLQENDIETMFDYFDKPETVGFYKRAFKELKQCFCDVVGVTNRKRWAIDKTVEELDFFIALLDKLLAQKEVGDETNFFQALYCFLKKKIKKFENKKSRLARRRRFKQLAAEKRRQKAFFRALALDSLFGAHKAAVLIDLFHFHETHNVEKFFVVLGYELFGDDVFGSMMQMLEEMGYKNKGERKANERRIVSTKAGKMRDKKVGNIEYTLLYCSEKLSCDVSSAELKALVSKVLHCCHACGKHHDKMKVCSRCKLARYCSKDCQKKDWKAGHKDTCCPESEATYVCEHCEFATTSERDLAQHYLTYKKSINMRNMKRNRRK